MEFPFLEALQSLIKAIRDCDDFIDGKSNLNLVLVLVDGIHNGLVSSVTPGARI
jgi:hypothetical protein